jgi:hypothetical protein
LLQCHEIAIEEVVTLEFRLFALRRPDSKERLRKAFEMSKAPNNDDAIYESAFGRLTKDRKFDNDLALLAPGPIVSSLILESHFEPENLSEKSLAGFWAGSWTLCLRRVVRSRILAPGT